MKKIPKNAAQSIMNNFNSSTQSPESIKAKFIISYLSQRTHATQQGVIINLINEGYDRCPYYEPYKEDLEKEFKKFLKSNDI